MENNENQSQRIINQMSADYGNNIAVRDQTIAQLKVFIVDLQEKNKALATENEKLKQPTADKESTKKAGK